LNTLRHKKPLALARHGWVCGLFLSATAMASTAVSERAPTTLLAQDTGITMTGRCPNGDAFRLVAYDKRVDGDWKSFYDYQGPVGSGTVKTKTGPKVMVSRVCIVLAEIASDE
jgi:hypothetical protein